MSDATTTALERAVAAQAPSDILRALLDAWATCHHPTIAELVETATKRIAERTPPRQPAGNLAARHAQWLSIAEKVDPLDLDWLLDTFVPPHSELAKPRIAIMARWPDDPRVATGLLGLGRTKPLVSYRPLWTQIVRVVRARAAHHLAPLVVELTSAGRVTTFDSWFQGKLVAIGRDLDALPQVAAPRAELVTALACELGLDRDRVHAKTDDDFLREIWAAPTDDGPRTVFADWLAERGDPRGELIALQLARAGRAPASLALRRERALLAEHGRTWMGPLEPVIAKSPIVAFERGFLYRAEVAWRRLAAMPQLMTHPAWSTVREYRLEYSGEKPCDRWLDHMMQLGARRL